jgi:hypothetical protein
MHELQEIEWRVTSMLQLTTPMRLHTKSGTYVTPRW